MRSTVIVLIILLSASLFGLVRAKLHVQHLHSDIKKMSSRQVQLFNEVQILKAEWAYLNRVERLEKLSMQHLNLSKISTKQVKKMVETLNNEKPILQSVSYNENILSIHNSARWRYKPRATILKNTK